jgi:hypothetical protein
MTIKSSVGVACGDGLAEAVREAARAARATHGEEPQAALVVTTGVLPPASVADIIAEAFGPVPMAGGVVAGILTDDAVIEAGAAVMCFSGDRLTPTTGCGGSGRGLHGATDRAGRLILAGSVTRRRYPRGFALAFVRGEGEHLTTEFLAPWRSVMGPKLRTVCSAVTSDVLYCSSTRDVGGLAVLCLEGQYQSGVGLAPGLGAEPGVQPETLVHGAVDAAVTAVKRLEGQPARGLIVVESAARHRALGSVARQEWQAMREQMPANVPCLGWLTRAECASGHGIVPSCDTGSVAVVAIGDMLETNSEGA